MKTKVLAACYRHINNGGVEYQIQKNEDDNFSNIRLYTQLSNHDTIFDSSVPLDVTTAKWLIKSLTDLLPELEKSQAINEKEDM